MPPSGPVDGVHLLLREAPRTLAQFKAVRNLSTRYRLVRVRRFGQVFSLNKLATVLVALLVIFLCLGARDITRTPGQDEVWKLLNLGTPEEVIEEEVVEQEDGEEKAEPQKQKSQQLEEQPEEETPLEAEEQPEEEQPPAEREEPEPVKDTYPKQESPSLNSGRPAEKIDEGPRMPEETEESNAEPVATETTRTEEVSDQSPLDEVARKAQMDDRQEAEPQRQPPEARDEEPGAFKGGGLTGFDRVAVGGDSRPEIQPENKWDERLGSDTDGDVVPVFHEKANISQATWCVLSIRHVLDFSRLGRGGTGFAGFHSHSWWSLSERDTVHAGVRLSRGAALSATT